VSHPKKGELYRTTYKLQGHVVGEATLLKQHAVLRKEPACWRCSYELAMRFRFFFSFVSSVNIAVKYNIREPKVKEIGKDKKNNLRANNAGHGEGVDGFLIVRRRFLGSWFGEFGRAGIFFVVVSLPLVPIRRSGRRRGDGLSKVRMLF
jgi:hypothetical protein